MAIKLVTAPVAEPITTAEAKTYLRVSGSAEDSLISVLITAARQRVEEYIERALVTQTWDLWLDRFPLGTDAPYWNGVVQWSRRELYNGQLEITLPRPPLVSVTHLKTYNDDDVEATFSSSNYIVDTQSTPGRIVLKQGQVWPTDLREGNSINVRFVAGYGGAGTVPGAIKAALYMTLGNFYEKRGDENIDLPSEARNLLRPYKVIHIGSTNPQVYT